MLGNAARRLAPSVGCGQYRLQEIPLTAEALGALRVEPEEIAAVLRDALTTEADLVVLADPAR